MTKKIILLLIVFNINISLSAHDKVFTLCTATQGNGYNWGSTLAWISEIVQQTVEKAESFEKKSKDQALIDLSCQVGASSGGFVTALYDQLLFSKGIKAKRKNGLQRQLLSIDEAKELSRVLRIFSLSTDFHGLEEMRFNLKWIKNKIGINPNKNQENLLKTNHWKHIADSKIVMNTFLKWIVGARNYQGKWDEEASSLFVVEERETSLKLSKKKIEDLDYKLKKKMRLARKLVDKSYDKKDKELVLKSSLSDDYCNSLFLLPADQSTTSPFNFDQLKIVYLCNKATYKKLLNSSVLKEMLKQSPMMGERIILGQVDHWQDALNLTMREPAILTELSGSLNQLKIKKASKLVSEKFVAIDNEETFLVMGGFPGPRFQTWISRVLLEERLVDLKSRGYEVEGRMATFGKTDNRNVIDSFAEKTIANFFGEQYLTPFYQWQDEICLFKNEKTPIEFFSMDWNLDDLPASYGDLSFVLTAKGINLARVQTDLSMHHQLKVDNFIYDPMEDAKYIPEQTSACLNF